MSTDLLIILSVGIVMTTIGLVGMYVTFKVIKGEQRTNKLIHNLTKQLEDSKEFNMDLALDVLDKQEQIARLKDMVKCKNKAKEPR